jgi:hypothetical protein
MKLPPHIVLSASALLACAGAVTAQELSTKEARQAAFVAAVIHDDVVGARAGEESHLDFKNAKSDPVEVIAERVTKQFLSGRLFTDIAKKYDAQNRGLLFLMYYVGGTLPPNSPCLSPATFEQCDDSAIPLEEIVTSSEFRAAYKQAQIPMKLPTIDVAFPFLAAE